MRNLSAPVNLFEIDIGLTIARQATLTTYLQLINETMPRNKRTLLKVVIRLLLFQKAIDLKTNNDPVNLDIMCARQGKIHYQQLEMSH